MCGSALAPARAVLRGVCDRPASASFHVCCWLWHYHGLRRSPINLSRPASRGTGTAYASTGTGETTISSIPTKRRRRDPLESVKKTVTKPIRALDLFAGVGGSSWGAQLAGVSVVAAVDAWDLAAETYAQNLPEVTFFQKRCERINLARLKREIDPIQLLLASPECTSHTCAKGAAARSEASKRTAFQVIRFARVFKPRWIVVENVVQIRAWHRYESWLSQLKDLGYHCREQILNAADFGVAQSRRRLFVICDRKVEPPEIIPKRERDHWKAARDIICRNGLYDFSLLKSEDRAEATLERARRAIAALGNGKPFVLVYYGSDGAGGWQTLDKPLRTITTLDRFAYVRSSKRGYQMRMLQVAELKKAMGFPQRFKLDVGTRRDKIKLLGNAVCPPVIRAIVRALLPDR